MTTLKEYCESCNSLIDDFKVIEVENDPYIICQECFKYREKLNQFAEEFMKKNKITMKDIEREVRQENKNNKK